MKSRHSLGEIRLRASEICFASEIFANAKVVGDKCKNYKVCEIQAVLVLIVGVVCFLGPSGTPVPTGQADLTSTCNEIEA